MGTVLTYESTETQNVERNTTDYSSDKTTGWAKKNVPLYFCPYLHQLLAHFQNSFTDTLLRQFAIT